MQGLSCDQRHHFQQQSSYWDALLFCMQYFLRSHHNYSLLWQIHPTCVSVCNFWLSKCRFCDLWQIKDEDGAPSWMICLFSDLLEKIKEADHILHAKCRCNQDTCLYAGFCFFDATSSKSCNLLLWIDWFHSSLHPLSTETINTLPSFIILILPSKHDQRNTGSI